jgi:hypothetical protein
MSSKGQRIGYVPVSSYDQNPDRQLEHLDVDRVSTDKVSGKDTERLVKSQNLSSFSIRKRPLRPSRAAAMSSSEALSVLPPGWLGGPLKAAFSRLRPFTLIAGAKACLPALPWKERCWRLNRIRMRTITAPKNHWFFEI